MNNKEHNQQDEFLVSGVSRIVSSPVFIAILVLTFILGVSSVFGFFQNPRKLKAIIDLIHRSVFVSKVRQMPYFPEVASDNQKDKVLLQTGQLQTIYKRNGYVTASSLEDERYSIFSKEFSLDSLASKQKNNKIDRFITDFDYNVASKNFWRNLSIGMQTSNEHYIFLGYKNPDLQRAGNGSILNSIIGVPISPYYSLDKNSLRYSLMTSSLSI